MSVLVNAQEQHIRNPDTFEVPTYNELNNIKLGDFVKVCINSERFWLKVIHITGNIIIGEVNNNLYFSDLIIGDQIYIIRDNIFEILKNYNN